MDPSRRGEIHPGADDNASGTAGVLALARWFAAYPPPRRGILFIAFGGEEFGLLGSNYYLRNPVLPLSNAVAVINLDMIGRMRDNKLYVGGAESSPGFKQLIAEMNRNGDGPFEIEDDDTGDYGSSDHFALATAEIPYLFFFTGLHPDYHTPRDTWDRIHAAGAARVLQLVGRILTHLVQAPDRPPFQRRSR
jgi:Zn-dependent M28 family amino/carboxypeptidase